jgi:hypothetical protein
MMAASRALVPAARDPMGVAVEDFSAAKMKRDHGTNGNNGTNGKIFNFPFVPLFPFVP